MIDPEKARAVLREYHATASDQQIIDDLRRHSPELARRLEVDAESLKPRQPMLNADEAFAWLEHHFDTVTDEELITTVKRVSPDLAQELWGDQSDAEILSHRPNRSRHSS